MLYVMVGLPGAGKSTYVEGIKKKKNVVVICPDSIRKELTGREEDQSKNREVFSIAHKRTCGCLAKGLDVVFDATNVNERNRKTLIEIAKKFDSKCEAVCIKTSVERCIKQNGLRQRHVPEDVIRRMATQFTVPTRSEGFDKVLLFG